jgi:hypothetical protein
MDKSLLQSRPETASSIQENGGQAPAEEPEILETQEQPFNDIVVEQRKPPVRIKFNPPFKYDGEVYHELVFDFDSMTGKDFLRAERKFQALYKPAKNEVAMPELKHLYHDIILGDLAGVSHHMIQSLERRYYVPLRTEALKACGSSSEEEKD